MRGLVAGDRDEGRVSQFLDLATLLFLLGGIAILPLWFWPWSENVFVHPKFEMMRVVTAGGALTAGGWLLKARPRFTVSPTDATILLFVLLNTVAFFFSVDHQTSLIGEPLQRAGLVTVFGLAGAYGIARLAVRDSHRLKIMAAVVAFTATVVALYGLVQLAGIDPVWSFIPGDRVFSSVGQPNWLAAYMVIAIPLTAALMFVTAGRPGRLVALVGLSVQIVVLVATRSRSGYLGFLMVLVIGAVLAVRQAWSNRRISMKVVALSAATLVLGGTMILGLGRTNPNITPSAISQRVISVADFDGSDAQRYVSLWKVGTAITLDHPLTGAGPDTYAILFPEYRDRVLDPTYADHFSRYRPESPHNVYLSISAGAGLPAALAYLVAIGAALFLLVPEMGATSPPSILYAGVVAAVAGHLVTDWFMTLELSASWLFWALIGAGIGCLYSRPGSNQLDEARTGLPRVE